MKISNVNITSPIKHLSAKAKAATNSVDNKAALALAATAAATSAMARIEIANIREKLAQNGYKEGHFESMVPSAISQPQADEIFKKYGEYTDSLLELKKGKLSKADIKNFSNFINTNPKLGKKMFEENFSMLLNTFLILKSNIKFKNINKIFAQNTEMMKMVDNIVSQDMSPDFMNTLKNWKDGVTLAAAQNALRGVTPDKNISDKTKKVIKTLSEGIDKSTLPENIKLYRIEGKDSLKNVTLSNGKQIDLGKMLKDAELSRNFKKSVNKIREFVMDNEITAHQKGFTSTSIDKSFVETFDTPFASPLSRQNVLWTFTTTPNTKGIFVEGLNASEYAGYEQEVLLQKGSKFEINDIFYNRATGMWEISAKVSN